MDAKIYFKPWVGYHYETGGIFRKKFLALGDSHYCGDECSANCGILAQSSDDDWSCGAFTENVISDFLNKRGKHEYWKNTFKKFERAMVRWK